jgi:hypothetical protein
LSSFSAGGTKVPQLDVLGLQWMHTFKSSLLSGVGSDAQYLAEHLACGDALTTSSTLRLRSSYPRHLRPLLPWQVSSEAVAAPFHADRRSRRR